jgi:hypothetical protein
MSPYLSVKKSLRDRPAPSGNTTHWTAQVEEKKSNDILAVNDSKVVDGMQVSEMLNNNKEIVLEHETRESGGVKPGAIPVGGIAILIARDQAPWASVNPSVVQPARVEPHLNDGFDNPDAVTSSSSVDEAYGCFVSPDDRGMIIQDEEDGCCQGRYRMDSQDSVEPATTVEEEDENGNEEEFIFEFEL